MESYHVFMFPFRWDYFESEKTEEDAEFSERTKLQKFSDLLNDKFWDKGEFKFKDTSDYNEYTYFYDFVREAIYDENPEIDEKSIIAHFSYDIAKGSKYIICIQQEEKNDNEVETKYELDIEEIYLHVYNTGMAILTFRLNNHEYKKIQDILRINEYGRRLYPQFLSCTVDCKEPPSRLKVVKDKFLADSIYLNLNNNYLGKEDFSEFDYEKTPKIDKLQTSPKYIPQFILKLLNEHKFCAKNSIKDQEKMQRIVIDPLIDDRMFVICWHKNDGLINDLQQCRFNSNTNQYEYNYQKSGDWYSYIFVDKKSPSCSHKNMLRELIDEHTYPRFADWGTLYGMSRYSFVCLTSSGEFGEKNIMNHVRTMYYQIVVLCLIQRGSILRFSREVARISNIPTQNNDHHKQSLKEIEQINEAYLKFVNQLYFREVTAQEQGIEIYDQMQKMMRIERDIKDLNREIDELYQYASFLEEKETNARMEKLTVLGAIFLIPTLITSFLGMNIFGDKFSREFEQYASCYSWGLIALLLALAVVTYFSFRKYKLKSKIFKIVLYSLIMLITIIIMIISLYINMGRPL